jgi:hypothetical protein
VNAQTGQVETTFAVDLPYLNHHFITNGNLIFNPTDSAFR